MRFLNYIAKHTVMTLLSLLFSMLILAGCLYFYMELQLPDVDALNDVHLQVPLRIYTSDGQLIGEFGDVRRVPVDFNQIPKPLINAVIATEDQRYYEHPGVDFVGLVRAAKELALTGEKTQGASTITMQVARNFFLTRKKTFTRKFNEILLALKLDSTFSKDKILELYFNKIYLGQHAYGVGAAAQVYYGKPLNQLTLPEMAMIAGLPQAPSQDNPITNPTGAIDRRNHVLQRMFENGYIDRKTYEEAIKAPNTASYHGPNIRVKAPYVAEMARNAVVAQYGDAAYTEGFNVYTTINSKLQQAADQAVRSGLLAYDQRHGYRGREQNLGHSVPSDLADWQSKLANIAPVNGLLPAAVVGIQGQSLEVLLKNGKEITLPWSVMAWTRRGSPSKVAKIGDVVRVYQDEAGDWRFAQVPKAEAALVSLNPNNGALLALVGGFNYGQSSFNRATQALRQPGSNFKPFIYAAALAKGYTLATIINDAPIVINDTGNSLWRPHNDDNKFYGPTRLRVALQRSQNLVSVRLLQLIGIPYAISYAKNFGFDPKTLPTGLSLALGSADVTPFQIATGYSVFANGGHYVTPYFVQQVRMNDGKVVFQANPTIICNQNCPANANLAPQTIAPDIAYLMTNAMKDVIRRGTGAAANALDRTDLAGKTGTSNNQNDAWFSGFNSNMVTTVWVGYDQPRSLYEFGAQAALPIWMKYMKAALAGQPEATMMPPADIVSVRIDPATGLLAGANQSNAIFEVFRKDNAPTQTSAQGSPYDTSNNTDAKIF